MRLRHVEELASEMLISQNRYWGRLVRRSRTSRLRRSTISSGPTDAGAASSFALEDGLAVAAFDANVDELLRE